MHKWLQTEVDCAMWSQATRSYIIGLDREQEIARVNRAIELVEWYDDVIMVITHQKNHGWYVDVYPLELSTHNTLWNIPVLRWCSNQSRGQTRWVLRVSERNQSVINLFTTGERDYPTIAPQSSVITDQVSLAVHALNAR